MKFLKSLDFCSLRFVLPIKVYDFCDPDQQEDINILGPIHWFNRVINHPEITQIVVIQSSGTDRCFEQFVNEENCPALTDDSDGLLRYVLHQLIEICSRNDINPYHRLFIAVYVSLNFVQQTLTTC